MDVSVLGLGYVGTVCSACLARRGHKVIGCDVQAHKVDAINSGSTLIEEPGLDVLIKDGCETGRLRATTNLADAIESSSLTLVCVGTPSKSNGRIDLRYLESICDDVGRVVGRRGRTHSVAFRSTALPSAMEREIIPRLIGAAGPSGRELLRICVNPEFLREGTAIADFESPPMVLIGEQKPGDADLLVELYEGIDAPTWRVGIKEAFMVKYASNVFHALKIVFGNEIGRLCQADGIDSHVVMDVFCRDRQLNISDRYLKPGYPYGGSCLPKDLRALLSRAQENDLELPLLSAVGLSNDSHIRRCVQAVLDVGAKRVGVLGLSFKDNTDDLRESPTVEIVERLLGKGLELTIHDKDVSAARIFGSNLTFVQQRLPHVAALMRSTPQEVIEDAEVVVLAKASALYADVEKLLRKDQTFVDLVRFFEPGEFKACRYVGLVG